MDRENFLARVRAAAHAGRAYPAQLQPFDAEAGYIGAAGELVAAMAAEVEAVGGEAQICDSRQQTREALQALLQRYQPHSALCWQHPWLDALEVEGVLSEENCQAYGHSQLSRLPHAQQRELALQAEVGITSCTWAIAETGSLLMSAEAGRERMASLLPPVHIALVAEHQIVPDLLDVWQQLRQSAADPLPSNIVLITGPSKTGDIELQLTTGVHGPKQWHVLITREPK